MKAIVILSGLGGELDRKEVELPHGEEDSAELSEAIYDAMSDWTLSVGDTISIVEAA